MGRQKNNANLVLFFNGSLALEPIYRMEYVPLNS